MIHNGIKSRTFSAADQEQARSLVLELCELSFATLSNYYDIASHRVDFASYLLPPSPELGLGGQVLIEENFQDQDIFLGLNFGLELYILAQKNPNHPQILGVIAEETSHLVTLVEVIQKEKKISKLSLEILGEIDRFIVLLHTAKIPVGQLCDHLFEGTRFEQGLAPETLERYLAAEEIAFTHLREAFKDFWTSNAFPWSSPHIPASQYLCALRERLMQRAA